ncbi:hypothetical protein VDGE_02836 [Verticillium dahliae]|uniref:Zn(2)-C6 fungal-type domain-containing protein n=1 Tax=Verticillium dahliae TaxID=27337 RepID=A0A444RRG0_VERDA|nr:hypothetical protein VDGE_02836 [Verticillium dahliae]
MCPASLEGCRAAEVEYRRRNPPKPLAENLTSFALASVTSSHVAVNCQVQEITTACNTCRSRKVKCDERQPICQRCSIAGRYCERTARPTRQPLPERRDRGHGDAVRGPSPKWPSPDNPRKALASPDIARIFHHYILEIAPWYDLSDPASSFATRLPRLALEMPLPFSAIIAQAAMQICQTTVPSQRPVAEFYHGHCVRLLIELRNDCGSVESEAALAAVCLLRSYEILDEEVDPNRHLHGAYSLASRQKLLLDNGFRTLSSAGFWNYLREDITYSLFEEQPLKMDLENIPVPTQHLEDHDHLNAISLVLGRILNAHFNDGSPGRDQPVSVSAMLHMLRSWQKALPRHFEPLCMDNSRPSGALPSVWMLGDCHAAARQYFLVSIMVLCMIMQLETLTEILQLVELDLPSSPSREDIVETCALEVCGLAFTAKSNPVLVNAFGPISYCARHIRVEASRQELLRCLAPCKKTVGWPVQRLMDDLQSRWRVSPA